MSRLFLHTSLLKYLEQIHFYMFCTVSQILIHYHNITDKLITFYHQKSSYAASTVIEWLIY